MEIKVHFVVDKITFSKKAQKLAKELEAYISSGLNLALILCYIVFKNSNHKRFYPEKMIVTIFK